MTPAGRRVRNAALEEAARVAEAYAHFPPPGGWTREEMDQKAAYSNGTVAHIARAIRSRKVTSRPSKTKEKT